MCNPPLCPSKRSNSCGPQHHNLGSGPSGNVSDRGWQKDVCILWIQLSDSEPPEFFGYLIKNLRDHLFPCLICSFIDCRSHEGPGRDEPCPVFCYARGFGGFHSIVFLSFASSFSRPVLPWDAIFIGFCALGHIFVKNADLAMQRTFHLGLPVRYVAEHFTGIVQCFGGPFPIDC